MPIEPEKLQLLRGVHEATGAHFWGQPVASTRFVSGVGSTGPCEPQPLSLCSTSGVCRPQLLVASRAAGLPALPAYCGDQGGLVLDRAQMSWGGSGWWVTALGRAKVQKMFSERGSNTALHALLDPDNFSWDLTSRVALGRGTVLRASIFPREGAARHRCWPSAPRPPAPAADPAGRAATTSAQPLHPEDHFVPVGAVASVRHSLSGERELTAQLALDYPFLEGEPPMYRRTPLQLSMDVASARRRPAGLHYRAGLHQVVARGNSSSDERLQPYRAVLRCQGAVALQGEATLWQGSKPSPGRRSSGSSSSSKPISSNNREAAAPQDGGPDGAAAAAEWAGSPGGVGETAAGPRPHGSSYTGAYTRRYVSTGTGTLGVAPLQLQQSLKKAAGSLGRLRTDIQMLTQRVNEGELRRRARSKQRGWAAFEPWSCFLPRPHIKLSGLLGGVARLPLISGSGSGGLFGLGGSASGEHDEAPVLTEAPGQHKGPVPSAAAAVASWVLRRAPPPDVRVFASGAVSAQLGQLQRSFLSFSRVVARVDAGLTQHSTLRSFSAASPSANGLDAAPVDRALQPLHHQRPVGHPSLELEARDARHVLTVSLSQQLLGSLRGCVDLRYSLSSPRPFPQLSGLALLRPGAVAAAADHVAGMRPQLMEAVYALDLMLPGSKGAARLVAWYAPARKEGMLELRLF